MDVFYDCWAALISYVSIMLQSGSKIRSRISAVCECLQGHFCSMCSTADSETRVGSELANILMEAVSKLNNLTKEVSYLQRCFNAQSIRMQKIGISNNESSECGGRNANRSSNRTKQSKSRSKKAKCKIVNDAKLNSSSQCVEVSSSEDGLGLRELEKRGKCKHSVDKSGSCVEESSLSSSSENSDSEGLAKKHRKRKVKSGA